MGSASSKFRKYLQNGDEFAAMQVFQANADMQGGLDPNASYGESLGHNTALHYAAQHAMKHLLRAFLFELGGNPNKRNSADETSLHKLCRVLGPAKSPSAEERRYWCLAMMLEWRGAVLDTGQREVVLVNAHDKAGNTALHHAAVSGLLRVTQLLLAARADLFARNAARLTACHLAVEAGHGTVAAYLETRMLFADILEPVIPPLTPNTSSLHQPSYSSADTATTTTADATTSTTTTSSSFATSNFFKSTSCLPPLYSDDLDYQLEPQGGGAPMPLGAGSPALSPLLGGNSSSGFSPLNSLGLSGSSSQLSALITTIRGSLSLDTLEDADRDILSVRELLRARGGAKGAEEEVLDLDEDLIDVGLDGSEDGASEAVLRDGNEGYCGLRATDLLEAKDELLVETSDMLHVPLFTAEALLRQYEWSKSRLLEAWMRDAVECCKRASVLPPASLLHRRLDVPQQHSQLAGTNRSSSSSEVPQHQQATNAVHAQDSKLAGSHSTAREAGSAMGEGVSPATDTQCGICLEEVHPWDLLNTLRKSSFNNSFESSQGGSSIASAPSATASTNNINNNSGDEAGGGSTRRSLMTNIIRNNIAGLRHMDDMDASVVGDRYIQGADAGDGECLDETPANAHHANSNTNNSNSNGSNGGVDLYKKRNNTSIKNPSYQQRKNNFPKMGSSKKSNSSGCRHVFCSSCWRRYLTVKIEEGAAHYIQCPAVGCNILVDVEFIEKMVSPEMARKYMHFDLQAFVARNRTLKWCPHPGCGRAVRFWEANASGTILDDYAGYSDCPRYSSDYTARCSSDYASYSSDYSSLDEFGLTGGAGRSSRGYALLVTLGHNGGEGGSGKTVPLLHQQERHVSTDQPASSSDGATALNNSKVHVYNNNNDNGGVATSSLRGDGGTGGPAQPMSSGPLYSGVGPNTDPPTISHTVDCGNGHFFCWECLHEAHAPATCQQWQRWHAKVAEVRPDELHCGAAGDTAEQAATLLWLLANSKPCPSCSSPIQKNEGCNHMKCSKCKLEFCWVCLEAWKKHSSATGGYFRCTRYDAQAKAHAAITSMLQQASQRNHEMQQLTRFLQHYTRYSTQRQHATAERRLLDSLGQTVARLRVGLHEYGHRGEEGSLEFLAVSVRELLKARHALSGCAVFAYFASMEACHPHPSLVGGVAGPASTFLASRYERARSTAAGLHRHYNTTLLDCLQDELSALTQRLSTMLSGRFLTHRRATIIATALLTRHTRAKLLRHVRLVSPRYMDTWSAGQPYSRAPLGPLSPHRYSGPFLTPAGLEHSSLLPSASRPRSPTAPASAAASSFAHKMALARRQEDAWLQTARGPSSIDALLALARPQVGGLNSSPNPSTSEDGSETAALNTAIDAIITLVTTSTTVTTTSSSSNCAPAATSACNSSSASGIPVLSLRRSLLSTCAGCPLPSPSTPSHHLHHYYAASSSDVVGHRRGRGYSSQQQQYCTLRRPHIRHRTGSHSGDCPERKVWQPVSTPRVPQPTHTPPVTPASILNSITALSRTLPPTNHSPATFPSPQPCRPPGTPQHNPVLPQPSSTEDSSHAPLSVSLGLNDDYDGGLELLIALEMSRLQLIEDQTRRWQQRDPDTPVSPDGRAPPSGYTSACRDDDERDSDVQSDEAALNSKAASTAAEIAVDYLLKKLSTEEISLRNLNVASGSVDNKSEKSLINATLQSATSGSSMEDTSHWAEGSGAFLPTQYPRFAAHETGRFRYGDLHESGHHLFCGRPASACGRDPRRSQSMSDLRDACSSCSTDLLDSDHEHVENPEERARLRLAKRGGESSLDVDSDMDSVLSNSMLSNVSVSNTDQGASSEIMGEMESPLTDLEVCGILSNMKRPSQGRSHHKKLSEPSFQLVVDEGTDRDDSASTEHSSSSQAPGKNRSLRIHISPTGDGHHTPGIGLHNESSNEYESETGIPNSPTLYISGVSICRSPEPRSPKSRRPVWSLQSPHSLMPAPNKERSSSLTLPCSHHLPRSCTLPTPSPEPRRRRVNRSGSHNSAGLRLSSSPPDTGRTRSASLVVPGSTTSPAPISSKKSLSGSRDETCNSIAASPKPIRKTSLFSSAAPRNSVTDSLRHHLTVADCLSASSISLQPTRASTSPPLLTELRLSKSASEYEKTRRVFQFPATSCSAALSSVLHVEESNLSSDDFHEALFLSKSPRASKRRKSKRDREKQERRRDREASREEAVDALV